VQLQALLRSIDGDEDGKIGAVELVRAMQQLMEVRTIELPFVHREATLLWFNIANGGTTLLLAIFSFCLPSTRK
jgi:hypothetical protein